MNTKSVPTVEGHGLTDVLAADALSNFPVKEEVSESLTQVKFTEFKFNNRPKPKDKDRILIVCCFSEFGCEVVGVTHCIPRLLRQYPGYYVIGVGWHGREYLYRHLLDEFWEVKEDYMWLREYCRAFHHESKNLKNIEKALASHGKVVSSGDLGHQAVGNRCLSCGHVWGDISKVPCCVKCQSEDIDRAVFGDPTYYKQKMIPVPYPSHEKMVEAATYLGSNPVAITARARKAYGRNLQEEFYVKLIERLWKTGHTPIWVGEKQSTMPCPLSTVLDYSRMPESRDLELTLALIKQCKLTIQFWTASTRLAALMGTPYLLFESPDQIYGTGQEGIRMELVTKGPKKLVLCHYLNVFLDNDGGIDLVAKSMQEMEQGDFSEVIGMVESRAVVEHLIRENQKKLGR